MTIGGGQFSLSSLISEFGRRPGVVTALGDFYGNASGVPSSGEIKWSHFLNKSFNSSLAYPLRNFYLCYSDGRAVRNDGSYARLNSGSPVLLYAGYDSSAQANYPNTHHMQDVTTGGGGCLRHSGLNMYFHGLVGNNFDFQHVPIKYGGAVQFYNYYGGGYWIGYNNDQVIIKQPNPNEYWYFQVPH
jgi:hypothetical protein